MTRTWLLLLGLAACGTGEVTPDAGGDDGDAGAGMGGLVFRFQAPGINNEVDDVRVTRLRLRTTNLRAIGDAGSGLDTYLEDKDIELEDGNAVTIRFDHAPPGRYSAFEFSLERPTDNDAAWEVEARADVDGENVRVKIGDEQTSTISLPLDELDLAAGQTVQVDVAIDIADFEEAIAATIDWSDFPSGDISIDDDDEPLIVAALRLALRAAFEIESITPLD